MSTPDPGTALQRALSALPPRPAVLIPPDQADAATEAIADLPEHVVAPLLIVTRQVAEPVLVIPVTTTPYPAHHPAPEGAPVDSLTIMVVTRDGFRYHVTRPRLGTPALTLGSFAEAARKAGVVSIDYVERIPEGEAGTLVRPMAAVIPWANVAAVLVETAPSRVETPAIETMMP